MSKQLDRIRAFQRRIAERSAERRVPSRFGTALFHDELSRVWALNVLELEVADARLEELVDEAERVHGEASLEHRRIHVDDETAGRRLAPGFAALGWKVEVSLVMPHRRGGAARNEPSRTRELTAAELRASWEAGIRSETRDEETVRQLLAAQELPVTTASARYFGAVIDGRPVSYCSLYSDGRTAQIESVMTLPPFRGRGLATATVTRALAESGAAGHDLTFLLADQDDWPKALYAKLGFESIGREYDFIRLPVPNV
jgi:GNAT superfamily N-acetyltransferase